MRRRVLVIFVVLFSLLVLVFALAFLARPAAPHPYYAQFSYYPLAIAHQGGDGLRPGDTLVAFQHAADLGVDVLEMDVHRSLDGHLVVIHDETVEHTTDGEGLVKEKTLAELKQLDAGYDWSADEGATFPYRGLGIQIPTLEEVFQAFPDTPLNIEIKQSQPPIAADLCALIRQYQREELVLVASFHAESMAAFRQVCPEVATSLAEDEVRPLVYLTLAYMGRFYKPQGSVVQVPIERSGVTILTPHFVRTAHQRGLRVEAWTIDDVSEMNRLIEMGVDGIITDYPDLLQRAIGRD